MWKMQKKNLTPRWAIEEKFGKGSRIELDLGSMER